MTGKISNWMARGAQELRDLGPYAPYALAAILPGGSILAAIVWIYRHSRGRSASLRHLSRNLSIALALASLAVLPGCVSSAGLEPGAHTMSADQLALSQTLTSESVSARNWPAEDWWTRFGDAQLDGLIAEGLESSPTLKEAEARTRAAVAAANRADAARFPQIDAQASSFRELFPAHSLYPPPYGGSWRTLNELQAGLSWELDFWGKNRSAYEAAVGEARAAALDARAARIALAASIAHTYAALAHEYLDLDVAQTLLAEREHIYSLTRDRNAAGIDSRLELTQAESALPDARERITQLEEQIALTRDALAALLGAGPDRGRAIERPALRPAADLELPSRLPSELLGRRPDILALRVRIEAARHGIERAKAEFYPDVNLSALAGLQSLGTGAFAVAANRELGVGPAITLPIFDAGLRRAELSARDADYDLAVEQYDQALADALREVVDQIVSFRSLETQSQEEREGLATAQAAYDLALLRYREEVGNYLQVLTTHEQLLAQRSLEADLRARAWDASIELARALGGGFVADHKLD
jgi:NodT family efflux transporter outer membrane factor (OMF) lipoprotein